MKANLLCFFMHSLCAISFIYPQSQIQGGLSVGGITYEGDLAPSSFVVSAAETHLDLGVFVYLRTTDWLGLKINYHHGTLSGSDATSRDEGRRARNLHFRSPLDELSVSGSFFYTFNTRKRKTIQPFLSLGLGVFRFNPQAEYNGQWYDLGPLSTEGQGTRDFPDRKPYKLIQICFPVGAGIQMSMSKRVQLTVDVSLRKTLTDYLDDVSMTYVPLENLRQERGEIAAILSNRSLTKDFALVSQNQSQRGIARNKDWYIIGSVGLVANILGKNKKENFFKKKNDLMNCKKAFKKRKH